MDIEQIIEETVNKTVMKLKMAGLMSDERKSTFQKTEELLKNYNNLILSSEPKTRILLGKINEALDTIREDYYYEVIALYYIDGESREYVADYFDTTVTTISRNKTRLINQLKVILFSDEFIEELYK